MTDSLFHVAQGGPSPTRPSVCFIMPKAYGVLTGQEHLCQAGGAEVQQTLIAHELLHRGWRVSFITSDYGQCDGETADGIRIFKTCRPSQGIRGLRFLHPRLISLWSSLRRANADVYVQRTAGAETAQVALWCRLNDKPFVYVAASKRTCQRKANHLNSRHDKFLFPIGLRMADAVIAQTHEQRELLGTSYGVKANVIPSCAPDHLTENGELIRPPEWTSQRFLWVGRFVSVKRYEWLLELADRLPHVAFDVVGNGPFDSPSVSKFRRRAEKLENLKLRGVVPHSKIGPYYDRATALLCTSLDEGFPNTFLEAWSRGVPVITTVDPDRVVAQRRLGLVVNELEEFATSIELLNANPDFAKQMGRRARSYFLRHHLPQQSTEAYERVLEQVIEKYSQPYGNDGVRRIARQKRESRSLLIQAPEIGRFT